MNVTDIDPAAQRLVPIHEGFRPLNDRVLARRIDYEQPSTILIPDIAATPSKRGVVLAVGPGKRMSDGTRRPLDVRAGDEIYFGRFTDFDNGDLVLIQEADIVGVITAT